MRDGTGWAHMSVDDPRTAATTSAAPGGAPHAGGTAPGQEVGRHWWVVKDGDPVESDTLPAKVSYTIPCTAAFRDAVAACARRRDVSPGDLARAVLLTVPAVEIARFPDPGEPEEDREAVHVPRDKATPRPWSRKPRLQIRMSPGYEAPFIRQALALALALDTGERVVSIALPTGAHVDETVTQASASDASARAEPAPAPDAASQTDPEPHIAEPRPREDSAEVAALHEEVARLRTMMTVLAFEPLPEGVRNRAEALYVLGFPPRMEPDSRTMRARYRMLAAIHHPDSPYGSTARMSQLNAAMELLRRPR